VGGRTFFPFLGWGPPPTLREFVPFLGLVGIAPVAGFCDPILLSGGVSFSERGRPPPSPLLGCGCRLWILAPACNDVERLFLGPFPVRTHPYVSGIDFVPCPIVGSPSL